MNELTTPGAFGDLLLGSDQFTVRELMKALGIGHPALKQRLADPSLFTLRELRLLSKLLSRPEMEVARMVFEEMSRNPQAVAELRESAGQVVGRQRAPRTPKQ
ncbi:MAG: hypothetical protein ACRYG7_07655 [Janthinobacterium lividum]